MRASLPILSFLALFLSGSWNSWAVDGYVLYKRIPGGDGWGHPGQLRMLEIGGSTTVIEENVEGAKFSPDASRIAYTKATNNGYGIFLANRDGSSKQMLKDGFSGLSICWRQSDSILFNYGNPRQDTLNAIDVSTGNITVIYQANGDVGGCSTDDNRRHYTFWRPDPRGVWVADIPTGSNSERHIDPGCSCTMSPDGTKFTNNLGNHQDMVVRNWDGSVYKNISTPSSNRYFNSQKYSHNSNEWLLVPLGPDYQLVAWSQVWVYNIETEEWVQITSSTSYNDKHLDFWIREVVPAVRIDSFQAQPGTIAEGESAVLQWETSNATSVRIDPGIGSVGNDGSRSVSPSSTTTYTLTAEGTGGPVNRQATVQVIPLRDADNPADTTEGVKVDYYSLSSPQSLPDFNSLTPYASDTLTHIDFPSSTGDFATSGRSNELGAVFYGYVDVPADGIYTFFTESDDGSALWIGNQKVIDNDGLHGMSEDSGQIGLRAGKHAIRVEFFEAGGGCGLIVRYQGPALGKRVIPEGAWHREVIAAQLVLSKNALPFSAEEGGSDPSTQEVSVSNPGDGTLQSVSTSIDYTGGASNWLVVTPSGSGNQQRLTNTVTLGSLTQGSYTATVEVHCANAGNSPQSYGVTLTVASQPLQLASIEVEPPAVNISEGESAQLTASAFDQLGGPFAVVIHWSVSGGGDMLPASSPAEVEQHVSSFESSGEAGTFTITASSGGISCDATVFVSEVDDQDPIVSIDEPGEGDEISGQVLIVGTASDNQAVARVEVRVDDEPFEQAVGTTDWSYTLDTRVLANGAHTLTARATDLSDNSAEVSTGVTVNHTPSVQITRPSGGERWQVGEEVLIEWAASNVTEVVIQYSINDGANWTLVTNVDDQDAGWESLPWRVPNTPSDLCRIIIMDYFEQASATSERFVIVAEDCDEEGYSRSCGSHIGACQPGVQYCQEGKWGECQGGVGPAEESCNQLDDNCDGAIDEGCDCTEGDSRVCGLDEGACVPGMQHCADEVWGLCEGGVGPTEEVCADGIDNDCDGELDTDCGSGQEVVILGSCACQSGLHSPRGSGWLIFLTGLCVLMCRRRRWRSGTGA